MIISATQTEYGHNANATYVNTQQISSDFRQLNVGSPLHVPVLNYLHNLQLKVDSFVRHSVCGRGIYTLKELETDVVCMLNTFALCPLDTRTFDDHGQQPDSNDLDSDGVYDSDSQDLSNSSDRGGNQGRLTNIDAQQHPAVCFCEFGVGSLFAHPIVERLFGPIPKVVQCS